MSRSVILLIAFVAALGASVPVRAADPHPFNVRDLVAMDRLSEPTVSPDGGRIALTISALDLDANRRRTDLWINFPWSCDPPVAYRNI